MLAPGPVEAYGKWWSPGDGLPLAYALFVMSVDVGPGGSDGDADASPGGSAARAGAPDACVLFVTAVGGGMGKTLPDASLLFVLSVDDGSGGAPDACVLLVTAVGGGMGRTLPGASLLFVLSVDGDRRETVVNSKLEQSIRPGGDVVRGGGGLPHKVTPVSTASANGTYATGNTINTSLEQSVRVGRRAVHGSGGRISQGHRARQQRQGICSTTTAATSRRLI